jgi:hypothetical protein
MSNGATALALPLPRAVSGNSQAAISSLRWVIPLSLSLSSIGLDLSRSSRQRDG